LHLSQAGRARLGLDACTAAADAREREDDELVSCVGRFTEAQFAPLAGGKRVHDVFPDLGVLTVRVMARALFGVDVAAAAERFFAVSMVHEDCFVLARRGDPVRRHDPRLLRMGEDAAHAQEALVAEWAIRAPQCPVAHLDPSAPHALVLTMLNAYAGVSATLAWAVWCLARNPAVQRRFHAEVDAVSRAAHCRTTPRLAGRHLDRLAYGKRVVLETLRAYPAAWMMSRTAARPTELGGRHVPQGSVVSVCTYSLQRDPRLFRNADAFDPDRFVRGESGGAPPFAFVPFGAGQHRCAATRMAKPLVLAVLANLALRFSFAEVPGCCVDPFPRIALRPEPGAFVSLAPRAKTAQAQLEA
jgi:cytochrome P450